MSQFENYSVGEENLRSLGFNNGLCLDERIEEDKTLIDALKKEFKKGTKMLPYSKGLFDGISVNEKLQDFRMDLEEREAKRKWNDYEPDL